MSERFDGVSLMKCPRTGVPLKTVMISGIEIDLSEGCGGVWLDQHELDKVASPSSFSGEMLVEHVKKFNKPLPEHGQRLFCPRDTDVVMMRRYYSPKRQVEIDECPQCGGVWLDAEELERIRDLFPDDKEYDATHHAFMDEVMSSPEVEKYKREHDAFIGKLNRISKLLWSMIIWGD